VAERVCSGLHKVAATILIQQLLNTRSRGVIVYVCAYVSQTQRHLFDLALQGDGNIVWENVSWTCCYAADVFLHVAEPTSEDTSKAGVAL